MINISRVEPASRRAWVMAAAVATSAAWLEPRAVAQPMPQAPSAPALQKQYGLVLDGVRALHLAWWFQHIADPEGAYFKPLAPETNESIEWVVTPTDDAHQLIGSVFHAEQRIAGGGFDQDRLHLQVQFADYITQAAGRSPVMGMPTPLNPTFPYPAGYTPRYPSPVSGGESTNGFNQHMLLFDGRGFAIADVLWSWKDVGADDTPATAGMADTVDLVVTMSLPWMEGGNRPPALAADGYYYAPEQLDAIWAAWEPMLRNLPAHLPGWFGDDTQDRLARASGWAVTAVIDTGIAEGVTSEMHYWWWNHAMGDAPGDGYVRWCPPAHATIRWLPGFSPVEVSGAAEAPAFEVTPGQIYPDLQGGNLQQTGGGMMSYPRSMSPVPGVYEHLVPMQPVSLAQVENFANVRFPEPNRWLLHQWEDRPGGAIHRSTTLTRLPLAQATTQQRFYAEHQMLEGQFAPNAIRRAWRVGHPDNIPSTSATTATTLGSLAPELEAGTSCALSRAPERSSQRALGGFGLFALLAAWRRQRRAALRS